MLIHSTALRRKLPGPGNTHNLFLRTAAIIPERGQHANRGSLAYFMGETAKNFVRLPFPSFLFLSFWPHTACAIQA